jgi:hypothetical protein
MRRLLPSHLLILGAALVVVSSAYAAATREDYVNQAEPVCESANKEIEKLDRRAIQLHSQNRFEAAGALFGKGGTRLGQAVAQIRKIAPPPGDETTVSSWLSVLKAIAANKRSMGRAEAAGDFATVVRLQHRNNRLHRRANRLVAGWGFYTCTLNT